MAGRARLAQEVSAQPGQRVKVGAEGVSPGRDDVSLVDREQSEPAARRGGTKGPGEGGDEGFRVREEDRLAAGSQTS